MKTAKGLAMIVGLPLLGGIAMHLDIAGIYISWPRRSSASPTWNRGFS